MIIKLYSTGKKNVTRKKDIEFHGHFKDHFVTILFVTTMSYSPEIFKTVRQKYLVFFFRQNVSAK